jgi:intracellular sulfur oxidation DsrE/DsrF family protein
MSDQPDVPELIPARMLDEFAYCPRLANLEWVRMIVDSVASAKALARRADRCFSALAFQPMPRRLPMRTLPMFSCIGVLAFALAAHAAPAAACENGKEGPGRGDDYDGSAPRTSKAFFDINQTDPAMMKDYLTVINGTYDSLIAKGVPASKIKLVLGLRGLTVTFVTQTFGVGTPNEALGHQIRALLTTLIGKGVRIEACQISLDWMGVPATSLLAGIGVIDNAFIESMWYQSNGYALVPVFQP